ncbi:hypothetical protein Q5O24_06940 [Eubacteriaceae bacterium ES3]|nr:hypothetical protein Q5O24_06940 [Eubacteriaceae bacterium ES3]
MEAIIYLLLIGLAIYLAYLFIVYIVIPVGGIALIAISGVAVVVGFISAITNYVSAVKKNINFISWDWEKSDEPAKRSYFFGPGYAQLKGTIKTAFELNSVSGKKVEKTSKKFKGDSDGIWGGIMAIGGVVYLIIADICIYVIGTILCAVFGLIHVTVTTVFMILTYIIFTIVWIIDRLYLLKNKIRSDCPTCHSRFLIPTFMCPECGAIHKKLVPGPYGIWKHKCTCGHKIPSTFLNGRSKLDAYCPYCGSLLVASDARQVVFQLIGGSKSGKTVFLSAYFHEYLEKLRKNRNLEVEIFNQYQPFFDELKEWYNGIDCPATAQLNSQMYPLLINSSLGVKRQFSIYDIAGEMFDGFTAESEILQQHFHYCNGLLFLIDPFSSGNLRDNRINSGEDMSDFSDMPVEDVVTNFINYLVTTGHKKANTRCTIPMAVLIAKSDEKEIKREIGPAKIASVFKNGQYGYTSYDEARDCECRKFLMDIGLSATVENLETEFSNLHYFPVSAMGHAPDGSVYEPWGVTDAIDWMLPLADRELADLITPPSVVNG